MREIILSIRGQQRYEDQEAEVIELVTEGTMDFRDGGWDISYQESALTGLEGVTTTFRVEQGKVTLSRTGKLRSQMVFLSTVEGLSRSMSSRSGSSAGASSLMRSGVMITYPSGVSTLWGRGLMSMRRAASMSIQQLKFSAVARVPSACATASSKDVS